MTSPVAAIISRRGGYSFTSSASFTAASGQLSRPSPGRA
jgi:hypothetical protein